ncbi:30S ribosome-binding factor RbfA [Sulfobacillus thermosulfidooxidans]|uniref:Ribosome-binding factor A n=2 Tax=Sulfobacillus thermosulfidooxidans TaxID=28034 RepID=A0A1W1WKR3_SULTA|nr:30S ribosome-binding factor RbfA [Sulfobacillus thermosulfidooxidans]OLZ12271.1 ribosome-binding factor A [Sulfobacillus thermosulfidooxidans]OLZ12948.1 ribosome-binding factor A [Sulfobacillus thermosulfidooxidans]OLZ21749.1 ribosome-binding factor A [Sulfobacillus thermosulfidooxidans]PSR27672.1 MAG: 30S ribosome-binding factor RbfA [Sulfobacillus thermosulfidooxidans]SMC06600.1 ribosome-binding factor A [Sulfobacillus thermosulfidooxidans DSM 9293]
MNKARAQRIALSIQQELGEMLQRDVKDPRIGFVSITHVDLSRDLSVAKVYVSHLGNAEEAQASLAGLKSATPFLRGEVARRLHLRLAPQLDFRLDTSIVESMHIQDILKTLPDQQS